MDGARPAALPLPHRRQQSQPVPENGADPASCWISTPAPGFRRQATATYTMLVETGQPWAAPRDTAIDGRLRRYEVVLLPLAADGVNVDMILGAMRFRTA